MLLFEDLLSRADAEVVERLLGKTVVQLLAALRPECTSAPELKKTLFALRPARDLLLSPSLRGPLLELLRPHEARDLVTHLNLEPADDPFKQLAALKVRRNSALETLLLSFFGVSAPEQPPEPEPGPTAAQADYPLFAHQRRVLRTAATFLSERPHRVLIHMPTGAGKTRTAMNLIAEHLREQEPGFSLWLAASDELCDQATEEFLSAWRHLGNRGLRVYRWWGCENPPDELPDDGFAVAGLAKLYSRFIDDIPWQARLGEKISLLVFDEAHQAVAPTYRHIVDAILARRPTARLVGLSATPGRTWNNVQADLELAQFFAHRKVMLTVDGYQNPVQYLIDEGYLARPHFRHVSSLGPELSDADRRRIAEDFDLSPDLLQRLADDHLRNLKVVQEVRDLVRQHNRVLIFAATVEHAEILAVVLSALGVPTRAVTASTAPSARDDVIRWYRDGPTKEPRVLTNFGVLTTGFDAPRTSAVLIARPTKSLVLYSQMVGRAIRGPKAGGNRDAEIVTVVDTDLPGFGDMTEAFTNWEDVWQSTS